MAENTVDPSYSFLHNGKEINMRRSTVTAERLGRYFNVCIETFIHLLATRVTSSVGIYIKKEFICMSAFLL